MANSKPGKTNAPANAAGLPSLDATPPAATKVAAKEKPAPAKKDAKKVDPGPLPETVQVKYKSIRLPWVDGLTGYARKRIDCNLTGGQAERLKSIQTGLEQENAKLANGRYVSTPTHAIQYLLEQAK